MRENSSSQSSAAVQIFSRAPALCVLAGRSPVAAFAAVAVADTTVPVLVMPSAQGNRPCEP
ncbi:unnamed protein product [Spirodela intermedia]|uniref:Uncharacterized protein n=2 Tax=Spirodela intermedia TaxID=51605 RepID=A0A7I8JQK9_SPIIN|nr:unnamed protein product [Spirodela intermedia]CAA6672426.1 unnamed protein product [Spirodela intermedia]CAA7409618.1 unnamed protein product [Spirodela intermedia]